jgi:hypothetical protein
MIWMNKKSNLISRSAVALSIVCGIAAPAWPTAAAAQAADETTAEILAARVRQQGFDCAKVQSVERDQKQSGPDEAVWILNCEGGAYKVHLVPDLAAKIERLKK